MTDVENLQNIIKSVFGVEKIIKSRDNTNRCIAPLNKKPLNPFAKNFLRRLSRLNKYFRDDEKAINNICERVKNIGEAKNSQWAGPYSELVALDFYAQYADYFAVSYINVIDINLHKNSIPFFNGQKEVIDIDLCLNLPDKKIYTDVKSFNSIHLNIFDEIFEAVEEYSLLSLSKSVMIGVDNLSSIDYHDVKSHLGYEKRKIFRELTSAVAKNERILRYTSSSGLIFTFRIEYSDTISTVKEYSPFAMAEAYKYKFLDYANKLVDDEYSVITMVKNPWFNQETVDFGDFNNIFYRSLARRTFIELSRMKESARLYSNSICSDCVSVKSVADNLAGIIFIDDNSFNSKNQYSLYSAYFYLNPNYANLKPLTIRSLEKYFRNGLEIQIKDFDDFRWDNY